MFRGLQGFSGVKVFRDVPRGLNPKHSEPRQGPFKRKSFYCIKLPSFAPGVYLKTADEEALDSEQLLEGRKYPEAQ